MSTLLDELRENAITQMDYVGFTFNGIHSSQLKILVVSDGSRYSNNLLPNLENYSIDIVGGYGSNYFGGSFKTKDIALNIAFDSVQEEHWEAIREWLGDTEVHELYFDENPYKVYHAVISKPPAIKFLAFGNVGTRVYKGEGTIYFTCYDPIGYSLNGKYLDDYDYENLSEWSMASRMLDNKDIMVSGVKYIDYYDTPRIESTKTVIHAYNAGTIATPFKLYAIWSGKEFTIKKLKNGQVDKFITFKRGTASDDPVPDDPILVDTERAVALELVSSVNTETSHLEIEYTDDVSRYTTIKGVQAVSYYTKDKQGNIIKYEPKESEVVLNQLIEDGRFFTLDPGYNELEIIGGVIPYAQQTGASETKGVLTYVPTDFQFNHRYL